MQGSESHRKSREPEYDFPWKSAAGYAVKKVLKKGHRKKRPNSIIADKKCGMHGGEYSNGTPLGTDQIADILKHCCGIDIAVRAIDRSEQICESLILMSPTYHPFRWVVLELYAVFVVWDLFIMGEYDICETSCSHLRSFPFCSNVGFS